MNCVGFLLLQIDGCYVHIQGILVDEVKLDWIGLESVLCGETVGASVEGVMQLKAVAL
jgi:hypothetical protein